MLPHFKENQYFRQAWLWAILLCINGLFAYIFSQQILFGSPFGNNQIPNILLIFIFTVDLVLTLLFLLLRLETEIRPDGIYYRFFPFQLKMNKISWDRITKAFVRKYLPITEYGGWGLRTSLKGCGAAFNVSGNEGLQLVYDNGKQFLLGTQRPNDIKKVLQELGWGCKDN